jgi:hypothetical protein
MFRHSGSRRPATPRIPLPRASQAKGPSAPGRDKLLPRLGERSCMSALLATLVLASTVYTLPHEIRWLPVTGKGVPSGATYAIVAGKKPPRPLSQERDAIRAMCDVVFRYKFPAGFVYPWHVNNEYDIYTVLKGTLVIGFDKSHTPSAERLLPAGSVMQGLKTEPHYGRAIGETVFDVFEPCNNR